MSKGRPARTTTYGPNCTRCGTQTPWPKLWNANTRSYYKTCPKCRAQRRRTRKIPTPSQVPTRVDPAIRLTEAERTRLDQYGTLRTPHRNTSPNHTASLVSRPSPPLAGVGEPQL